MAGIRPAYCNQDIALKGPVWDIMTDHIFCNARCAARAGVPDDRLVETHIERGDECAHCGTVLIAAE